MGMKGNAPMLFRFDVTLMSELWTDDTWSVDDYPTKEDFQNAFDRSYFGSGEFDLHTDESTFDSNGGSNFIGLEIEEGGQIEVDSAGWVAENLEKGDDGYWVAEIRNSSEIELSVDATNEKEARQMVTGLAKVLFLVRDLPVEKISMTLI
jgi:hypothetical protein